MKKIVPIVVACLAVTTLLMISNVLSAEGATSKAVSQAQINKLQNQVDILKIELSQSENAFSNIYKRLTQLETQQDDKIISRHVWLAPGSSGCGEGAIAVSTLTIPGGTSAGITGCVADVLVKPLSSP